MANSPYLPLKGNEIRLLNIQSGSESDALRCSLRHHDLDSSKVSYIAVSYPWGPPEDPHHECQVDGIKFTLRDNAFNILTRLRQEDSSVDVWIDVLCIHQSNKPEKSHQINLMYRIYAQCQKVVIWLGRALEPNDEVIEYIKSIDIDTIKKEFVGKGFETVHLYQNKSFILDMLADHPRKEHLINGSARLFDAVWFSRVWIRQEAAVGADPQVLWGEHQLSWMHVVVLAWLFRPRYTISFPEWTNFKYNKLENATETILAIQNYRFRIARETESVPATPLFSMMVYARPGLTTKPHDKVYALSSMASDISRGFGHEEFLKPNYNLSWQEVYVNAARMFFSYNSQLVLEHAGLIYQGVNSDLPSWVPDWRYPTLPWMVIPMQWFAGSHKGYIRTRIQVMNKKQRSQIGSYKGFASITPLCVTARKDKCKISENDQYIKLGPKEILSADIACDDPSCKDKVSKTEYGYLQSAAKAAQILEIQTSMQDKIVYLGDKSTWVYDNEFTKHHRKSVSVLDAQNLTFLEARALETNQELYITDETIRQAYNATLIMSQDQEDQVTTTAFISTAEEWRAWLVDSTDGPDGHFTYCPTYHLAVENRATFRDALFAYTENGYMALVPRFTQSGDSIVIINGYRTPFVIRPTVEDWYILVGPCYVHGMMTGDAFKLMEEFDIRVDEKTGETRIRRPQGDIRANGLKMECGRYVDILHTLGNKWIKLI
ncbi:hypothetical protein H2198_005253 [Neophaeococcomyces mojaviensis]|uniref:Uncharacterized protein n=1 Tax=Neophaeococcomyces mojaviensis TaxID=3383035 RepID=A0ACC3A687_9EURO|nr:hypothetical protein H2198_005253 [Knufia sp. JES_112]